MKKIINIIILWSVIPILRGKMDKKNGSCAIWSVGVVIDEKKRGK